MAVTRVAAARRNTSPPPGYSRACAARQVDTGPRRGPGTTGRAGSGPSPPGHGQRHSDRPLRRAPERPADTAPAGDCGPNAASAPVRIGFRRGPRPDSAHGRWWSPWHCDEASNGGRISRV